MVSDTEDTPTVFVGKKIFKNKYKLYKTVKNSYEPIKHALWPASFRDFWVPPFYVSRIRQDYWK